VIAKAGGPTENTDTGLSAESCTVGRMSTTFVPSTTPNTLAWFEVATDDPDTATSCYGDLFGWSFQPKELEPAIGPAFAYLHDPVGSLFGVFTPPVPPA